MNEDNKKIVDAYTAAQGALHAVGETVRDVVDSKWRFLEAERTNEINHLENLVEKYKSELVPLQDLLSARRTVLPVREAELALLKSEKAKAKELEKLEAEVAQLKAQIDEGQAALAGLETAIDKTYGRMISLHEKKFAAHIYEDLKEQISAAGMACAQALIDFLEIAELVLRHLAAGGAQVNFQNQAGLVPPGFGGAHRELEAKIRKWFVF